MSCNELQVSWQDPETNADSKRDCRQDCVVLLATVNI